VAYVTIPLRTRQPMTNSLVLLVHWSVRQKLNRVSLILLSLVTALCMLFIY